MLVLFFFNSRSLNYSIWFLWYSLFLLRLRYYFLLFSLSYLLLFNLHFFCIFLAFSVTCFFFFFFFLPSYSFSSLGYFYIQHLETTLSITSKSIRFYRFNRLNMNSNLYNVLGWTGRINRLCFLRSAWGQGVTEFFGRYRWGEFNGMFTYQRMLLEKY